MWKIVNAMAPAAGGQYGPLPCRRWVKAKGDRRRLHYRAPVKVGRLGLSSNSDMEFKAAAYAVWLARRDGVALPEAARVTVHWTGVNAMRPNGRTYWDKRIRAVSFGEVTIDLPNWDFSPVMPEVETLPDDLPEPLKIWDAWAHGQLTESEARAALS